jgi:hypothetical protein
MFLKALNNSKFKAFNLFKILKLIQHFFSQHHKQFLTKDVKVWCVRMLNDGRAAVSTTSPKISFLCELWCGNEISIKFYLSPTLLASAVHTKRDVCVLCPKHKTRLSLNFFWCGHILSMCFSPFIYMTQTTLQTCLKYFFYLFILIQNYSRKVFFTLYFHTQTITSIFLEKKRPNC